MAKTNKSRMAELENMANAAAQKYNELILDGKYDVEIEEEISKYVNEYTAIAKTNAFSSCKAADNPMHEACKMLYFDTIRCTEERPEGVDKDSKLRIKRIVPAKKLIDLKRLMKFCDGNLGADNDWIYALEKFNFTLTAQRAKELNANVTDINDSYAMRDIARQYDLGKNPASKTNLLKSLTKIVQMMLGDDYKPLSHDVNYLLAIYSKKGRGALKVVCANHNIMRQYVQEICHRILTNGVYEVDFKRAKQQ